MKKILNFLLIGLLFAACNPMDDINETIDSEELTNKATLDYTLTSDDYDGMESPIDENHYFTDEYPATDYIPAYLAEAYPALTEGSSVNVTYNYKAVTVDYSQYTDATTYSLTEDDYATVSDATGEAGYFSPSYAADDYIPEILASSITEAEEGDVYIISYDYSDIDPETSDAGETTATLLEATFESDLEDFQTVSVSGDQEWAWSSYGAKMSGYSSGAQENEDWLITPELDLTNYSSGTVSVSQAINYLNDNWDQVQVLISTDYNGSDPSSATWSELTLSELPTGSAWDYIVGTADISAYCGSTAYIAFKYESTTSNAATWEINAVTVTASTAAAESTEATALETDFESDLEDFQTVSVTGDQEWAWSSYGAKMSGYSSGYIENEDWLITPSVSLGSYSSATLSVSQAVNYINDNWDLIGVYVSTDYDGSDPSSATWTELTLSALPDGDGWDYTVGTVDISSYCGSTVYVGFKYTSTTSVAPTWEINNITISGTTTTSTKSTSIIADAVTLEELYTFDGTDWKKTEEAYYLTSLDYDAMGEASGQPGKYNNFSSSIDPADYLPQLAEDKYPYAQDGDTIVFVYKYYSSETYLTADKLEFTDGAWQMSSEIITEKTDQYILASSGWVFDPTVNYTMTADDYQTVVDYVANNFGSDYVDSYGTGDYYYGASAYYSEFRTTDTYRETSVFDSWEDAATEAIGTVFLPSKYPSSSAQVDGIDVYYVITFAAYENSTMVDYTVTFQCTGAGEFTYSEGPTEAE